MIKLIHRAKGLAILAHPWYFEEKLEFVLDLFLKSGGDGIEVCKPVKDEIPKEIELKLRKFAKKNNMIISGGTDFHEKLPGEREIGDRGVSLLELKKLRKCYALKFK